MSSRYDGEWNQEWEPYFARKFVRRLWAEEIHDAVAVSSGTLPTYSVGGFTTLGFPSIQYAMQLPDAVTSPGDRNANDLLTAFIRGNRDDQPRKSEGSILQALNLMNNVFITNRVKATGASGSRLIAENQNKSNPDLINTLFLSILSRYPTAEELSKISLPASGTARTNGITDLVWSLYNKVDFVFNY